MNITSPLNSLYSRKTTLYTLNPPPIRYNNLISFGSDNDKFEGSKIKFKNFAPNISQQQQENIISSVKEIASDDSNDKSGAKFLASGANGAVYLITDNNSSRYVVKISHKNGLSKTGEKQRININFDNEKNIMQKLADSDINGQKYVADFTLNDGRSVLVSTFLKGKNPDVSERPLTSKSLSQLLNTLEIFDEKGILHRDLKKENIIIDSDNNAGLIDYGEAIEFNIKNSKYNSEVNNFPEYIAPSNLRNFEDTLIFPYMNEVERKNPNEAKEFFKNYLTLKSELYSKRADSIERYMETADLTESEKNKLNEMLKYQKVMSEILKNADDDVIKTEMLNGQITYNSELAYKNEILLLNPLANVTLKMNALTAAKRLEVLSDGQLKKPNTILKRDYYKYQNDYAKYRLQKISSWTNGLVNWLCDCFTSDLKNLPEAKTDIVNQFVNGNNIQNFEIPKVETL